MSHIPTSAVPHAKKHDQGDHADTPAAAAKKGKASSKKAADLGKEALATVKAHPKTAIAIGATIVAGAVAAVAAPLLGKRDDDAAKAKHSGKKAKAA